MMSKSRVLVFVVTFMSFIDYSYLSKIVVLPSIEDNNFKEYINRIDSKIAGKILNEDEFNNVKKHYENEMKVEYEKSDNARLVKEISKITTQEYNEKRILRILMNYEGCGKNIQARLHEYIKTRETHYYQKIQNRENNKDEKTHPPEIETMHHDNELLTLEKQKEEELDFLNSLNALSDNKGRIKSLYLSTVYGSNQHIINRITNSIDSIWLYLLRIPDPMFGEKYNSYAFRVISMNKMPLPKDEIPKYYGNGKLYLFDEFDIWPELNAVFIMYYLFNCPLQETINFDTSHDVTDISEHHPILS